MHVVSSDEESRKSETFAIIPVHLDELFVDCLSFRFLVDPTCARPRRRRRRMRRRERESVG
jgi:hypothetical protein